MAKAIAAPPAVPELATALVSGRIGPSVVIGANAGSGAGTAATNGTMLIGLPGLGFGTAGADESAAGSPGTAAVDAAAGAPTPLAGGAGIAAPDPGPDSPGSDTTGGVVPGTAPLVAIPGVAVSPVFGAGSEADAIAGAVANPIIATPRTSRR
jgi:hypothetical protein